MSTIQETVKESLYQNQHAIYNGLFILYLFFLQEPVLVAAREVVKMKQPNLFLGVLLLLAIVCETIALPKKFGALQGHSSTTKHKNSVLGILMFVWLGHIIITIGLGMTVLDAFGIDTEAVTFAFALIPILVVKEIVVGSFFGKDCRAVT